MANWAVCWLKKGQSLPNNQASSLKHHSTGFYPIIFNKLQTLPSQWQGSKSPEAPTAISWPKVIGSAISPSYTLRPLEELYPVA